MSTPDYSPATIGRRIKAGRQALRLSQREFGVLVGYGHGYISDIESDRSPASRKFLQRVAARTPLSLAWMEDGSGSQMREREPIVGGTRSRVAESAEEYELYRLRSELFPGMTLLPPDNDLRGDEPGDDHEHASSPPVLFASRSRAPRATPSDTLYLRHYKARAYVADPPMSPLPAWMVQDRSSDASACAIVDDYDGWMLVDTSNTRIDSGTLYVLRIADELMARELQRMPGGVIAATSVGQNAPAFEFNPNDATGDAVILGKVLARFVKCP